MHKDDKLAGFRVIGHISRTNRSQAKQSIRQQKRWLREYASAQELIYVDDLKDMISVSPTLCGPDVEMILHRKKNANDFDAVLVQDPGRLIRRGFIHWLTFVFRLKEAGIRLITLSDGLIDGDEQPLEVFKRFSECQAEEHRGLGTKEIL